MDGIVEIDSTKHRGSSTALMQLELVLKAYRQTLVGRYPWKLFKAAAPSRKAWLLTVSALGVATPFFAYLVQPNTILTVALSCSVGALIGVAFDQTARMQYSAAYATYPELMKHYGRERQFFRYLDFRKILLDKNLSRETAGEITSMLVERPESEATAIWTHPLMAAGGAVLLMLSGKIVESSSIKSTALLLGIVLVAVCLPLLIAPIHGFSGATRKRDRELRMFLHWYAAEKTVSEDSRAGCLERGRRNTGEKDRHVNANF